MCIQHGTYIGKNPALKGEGALLRPLRGSRKYCLAQFDNLDLPKGFSYLAYDWQMFHWSQFELDITESETPS